MPDDRNSLLPSRLEDQIWAVMRRLAPVLIAVGVILVAVGAATGQTIGIVAIDVVIVLIGVLLLLVVRWHR